MAAFSETGFYISLSPTSAILDPQADTKCIERNEFFFSQFENFIFLAESTLFKVPRYCLPSKDGIFTAMFALPSGNSDSKSEGSAEDNPIVLPSEVTAYDFRSLLKAALPRHEVDIVPMSAEEWMPVLKLASLDTLRTKAIDSTATLINHKTPLEKIQLGRQYRVSEWLIEGIVGIGGRKRRFRIFRKKS